MAVVKRFVNKKLNSNSYLFYDDNSVKSDSAYLIDCGDTDMIIDFLKKIDKKIEGLFITHSHYDHIYGMNSLLDYFPNVTVYASKFAVEGLFSTKKNLSKYHEDDFIYKGSKIVEVKDNQIFKLTSSLSVKTILTPGHDKSSTVFILNDYAIFTGDSYIPGVKTVTSFPGSNDLDEEKSSKLINKLLDEIFVVFPGHGNEQKMK